MTSNKPSLEFNGERYLVTERQGDTFLIEVAVEPLETWGFSVEPVGWFSKLIWRFVRARVRRV